MVANLGHEIHVYHLPFAGPEIKVVFGSKYGRGTLTPSNQTI